MTYDHDIICIGLGPAGMAVSIMASHMGLNVCAIEKDKIGGECMNVGCIPSKALLRFARNFNLYSGFSGNKNISSVGLKDKDIFIRIQGFLEHINTKKNAQMFEKVNLILGEGAASFVNAHTIRVGKKTLTARKIFIATGTRPAMPPIPGLDTIKDVLTNNNIFLLEKIPASLTIIGGGAIGCEMAQAFNRLGTKCRIVHMDQHLLPLGDKAAAEILERSFIDAGIEVYNGKAISSVLQNHDGVTLTTGDEIKIVSEKILVAAGRRQEIEGLKLENAGVHFTKKGITVNHHLQTNQPHILAVGDCNGHFLLSHAAMHQGMIALMNTMIPWPFKICFDNFIVPWTVFTEPQLSCAGVMEKDLKIRRIRYETILVKYEDYGAAIAEEIGTGFVKVFCTPGGRVLGACIIGEGSGEMINEWALAIQKKIRLHDLMMLQHSFPTMGFLSKRIAETWMMNKIKPTAAKNLCRLLFRIN